MSESAIDDDCSYSGRQTDRRTEKDLLYIVSCRDTHKDTHRQTETDRQSQTDRDRQT